MAEENHSSADGDWNRITPIEFERSVRALLQAAGRGLDSLHTEHREQLIGLDGEFEIDVTVRFRALGVDFLVLVECKHHQAPVKRELVQVLYDKVRSTGAQKGLMFSTSYFQTGAIEYAAKHGIGLIRLAQGNLDWPRRGPNANPTGVFANCIGWFVRIPGNRSVSTILTTDDPRPLIDFLLGRT